jgi:hypothetical protein
MSLYHLIPAGAGRPPEIPESSPVNFILRYRGPLSTSRSHAPNDKHRVREYLHPQLAELCRTQPFYQKAQIPDLPAAELKGPEAVNIPPHTDFYCVPLGGYEFVPLISRNGGVVCQLDITWFRREEAGKIVDGGDIDNRLKTLFDGLRMPLDEKEIIEPASPNDARRYCLLQDDRLITKLSVSTYQLLEPLGSGERAGDVDLLLHITVEPTVSDVAHRAQIANDVRLANSAATMALFGF